MPVRLKLTLFLLISTIALFCFFSCSQPDAGSPENGSGEVNADGEELLVPDSIGLGRIQIPFSDIEYTRPDYNLLAENFAHVATMIEANEIPFFDQLMAVYDLYKDYDKFLTMKTYAEIVLYRNSADTYFVDEYEHLSSVHPALEQLSERVMVAAAKSPYAVQFEDEFFENDLVKTYGSGAMITDELIELFRTEQALIASYKSLSASVGSISGTDDVLLPSATTHVLGKYIGDHLHSNDNQGDLYIVIGESGPGDIMVELIKVRQRIAAALGYSDYIEYSYDILGYDYSSVQAEKLIGDIANYAVPVYNKLLGRVFAGNNKSNFTGHGRNSILNRINEVLRKSDDFLFDIYAYMLHYGYFDVENSSASRYNGAFTTHLRSHNSPYLFVTLENKLSDYMILSHEFGHFVDMVVNDGEYRSLDLMEVSSQAMELLMLLELDGKMSREEYNHLYYSKLEDVLLTLIYQGFYTKLEHSFYKLPYHEITKETLDSAVRDAANAMALNPDTIGGIDSVIIPHLVVEPFYVQSYCTSAVVALQIFFAEIGQDGNGADLYTKIIGRKKSSFGFLSYLELTGLDSPFETETVKYVLDEMHYIILGSHYFNSGEDNNTAMQIPDALPVTAAKRTLRDAA